MVCANKNIAKAEKETMAIRIVIANDHRIFRQGLRALLEKEPGMKVVGEADDGLKTIALVRKLTPHVVITDVNLPNLNGIEATRQILADYPAMRIIVLSKHADRNHILNMLKVGACGYLLKDSPLEELVKAIRLVFDGKTYLSPGVTEVVVKDYARTDLPPDQPDLTQLTAREREVLKLVVEGKSTKQIAGLMKISVKTIETHRQKIMSKLGTHSVADLTKYALREGLTSLES
jgi:DNA-binding NarL/FixJ family response regulator